MTTPVYITLVALAMVIELIFAPLFLKEQRPGKSTKSCIYKMICATMFVCIGVLSFFHSGNETQFAMFMLIGAGLSWVGDLFLGIKGKFYLFIIGVFAFGFSHIMYLVAYSKATLIYFPERKFIRIPEVIAIIIIAILAMLYYTKIKKMDLKSGLMAGLGVYGLVLITMLVKAAAFAIEYIQTDNPNKFAGAFCLFFGGLMFFASDTSLLLLMFNEKDKGNYRLKDYNIATYFIAQTLLGLSISFIGF